MDSASQPSPAPDALHEQLLDPSFHTLWFPTSKLSRHSLQKVRKRSIAEKGAANAGPRSRPDPDSAPAQISRRCPRIRSLDLSECFLVDDETVKEILLALPCAPPSRRLLAPSPHDPLPRVAPDISSLRVEGCRKLSDAAVPHLLAHGASLEVCSARTSSPPPPSLIHSPPRLSTSGAATTFRRRPLTASSPGSPTRPASAASTSPAAT